MSPGHVRSLVSGIVTVYLTWQREVYKVLHVTDWDEMLPAGSL